MLEFCALLLFLCKIKKKKHCIKIAPNSLLKAGWQFARLLHGATCKKHATFKY
jgi:hypothetical protein